MQPFRTSRTVQDGLTELHCARRVARPAYWTAMLFSCFANLLMLTGPLYMLQVYDRVLGSRSVETLVVLSILAAFLYLVMGLLDYARGRLMGRVAARFVERIETRVFDAGLNDAGHDVPGGRDSAAPSQGRLIRVLSDLRAVERLMTAPALNALFDLPWTPLFLLCIWVFHPWLGALALVGGAVLVLSSLANQRVTRRNLDRAAEADARATTLVAQMSNDTEALRTMGLRDAACAQWRVARALARDGDMRAGDLGAVFVTLGRTLRLMLQSAMLGLGAYLVLRGALSPGAMIASSILMGRALQPVEQIVGQWALFQRGLEAWQALAISLGQTAPPRARLPLPPPSARLEVHNLTVVPPGERTPALHGLSFTTEPGQAIGVIGASGSGKSTLARVLTGLWPPLSGDVRLGGAPLGQYSDGALGRHVGYLPQRVNLFDGTIAQNIARLLEDADAADVIAAARKAGAHEMILALPDGYDTMLTPSCGCLSGGQVQRIGLARAMFGAPALLVLDEPNSNLDGEGSAAVNDAVRAAKRDGQLVLVMAHRPAAIQECDHLLMLENGAQRAFGPRDKVLRDVVRNHAQIVAPSRAEAG
ncbi:type I secretion system permease/ATPase [Rhodobacteraceae bacterium KMM 6894]|nr:type I secretion system permease/ATPase [Rhodobacteraceae bacterium KMM 6894]